MPSSLCRESVRSLTPAFSFPSRSEERGLVNLRDNENPFAGPQQRYPDNFARELATRYLHALDVLETPPTIAVPHDACDGLLLTRGASDALDLIFRAFFEPGRDRVAVTPPNFRLFDELAAVYGVTVQRAPLAGDDLERLDVDALIARPAQGIVLCDPNNPVGSSLNPEDVAALLKAYDGVVVIDEAYVEYTRRPSYRHWIAAHPNLVVVRSLSKALGMAGLRVGAIFAQPSLIAALRKVRLPFALPRPVIEQACAELADPARLRAQIDAFIAERDRVADALRNTPAVSAVRANAGFISVRAPARVIGAVQRAGFDPLPDPMGWTGHLRLSVATPDINDHLIDVLTHLPSEQ